MPRPPLTKTLQEEFDTEIDKLPIYDENENPFTITFDKITPESYTWKPYFIIPKDYSIRWLNLHFPIGSGNETIGYGVGIALDIDGSVRSVWFGDGSHITLPLGLKFRKDTRVRFGLFNYLPEQVSAHITGMISRGDNYTTI